MSIVTHSIIWAAHRFVLSDFASCHRVLSLCLDLFQCVRFIYSFVYVFIVLYYICMHVVLLWHGEVRLVRLACLYANHLPSVLWAFDNVVRPVQNIVPYNVSTGVLNLTNAAQLNSVSFLGTSWFTIHVSLRVWYHHTSRAKWLVKHNEIIEM